MVLPSGLAIRPRMPGQLTDLLGLPRAPDCDMIHSG
jgi:hypothetical protein